MHLWEADHPYYCSEGNFYSDKPYSKHATWSAFLANFKDSDLDLNLIFRFDWREGEDWGAGEFNGDQYYRNGTLQIFFVFQRKGIFACHEISVCRADEPSVVEFLKTRWGTCANCGRRSPGSHSYERGAMRDDVGRA